MIRYKKTIIKKLLFIIKNFMYFTGLPHFQGTQGSSGYFEIIENLRETQDNSGYFGFFLKLRIIYGSFDFL